MATVSIPTLPLANRIHQRTVLVASADRNFRQRLSETLTGLRWQVREADGGAQAWAEAEVTPLEAVIVDSWLPDLDLDEFLSDFRINHPEVDLVTASGSSAQESPRGPYRQELLYALRRSQDNDTAIWNAAPALNKTSLSADPTQGNLWSTASIPSQAPSAFPPQGVLPDVIYSHAGLPLVIPAEAELPAIGGPQAAIERLPEIIGYAPCMLEISRRVRLVAPRSTPVLIEGPTGSGKELVAEALHRLSARSRNPFVAINCAAIPEALLEAELFGHTRGAFTGAVQGRVGRIEAADGGTLFLDEIGEMPLALQSKLLRFVECGELQRVGDNEKVKVDVRIVAATHQALAQQTQDGGFRADLYYRLAVFLIRTPSLAEHTDDLPLLVNHFLAQMGRAAPIKRVDPSALAKLTAHDWPGNVRELEHVLERAAILAGEEAVITAREIDFGLTVN
ncbi:MAG TPA: sigma-54 dependent transcriptional regulator [Terracidiphilus sp.]|nr:sigma-54 dependent transcriptional regulator [Terracidiphilus sp.]